MKKITDKERLDWLLAGGKVNSTMEKDWWVAYDNKGVQHGSRYPRSAINRALKYEAAYRAKSGRVKK